MSSKRRRERRRERRRRGGSNNPGTPAAHLLQQGSETSLPLAANVPMSGSVISSSPMNGPHPLPDLNADTEQFLRTVSSDVVDKQYRLYAWADAKNQALITTNSLLFAAVGFLYKECVKDTLALSFLGLGVAFIAFSLIMCLTQVLCKITSGKSGKEPNTRSLRGISSFKTWEDYRGAVMRTTKAMLLADTIRQIYGMASNNMRSAKIIKCGVWLTSSGVLMILGAVCFSALSARGYHAFGAWQQDTGQAGQNTQPASPTVTPQTSVSVSGPLAPAKTLPTTVPYSSSPAAPVAPPVINTERPIAGTRP